MITLDSLRQQVQQARDIHYQQAVEYGEMPRQEHWEREERAYGRVEAYDEVLAMLAEGERQEQLTAGLGSHAGLPDPVHGGDIFSRIEASTHD